MGNAENCAFPSEKSNFLSTPDSHRVYTKHSFGMSRVEHVSDIYTADVEYNDNSLTASSNSKLDGALQSQSNCTKVCTEDGSQKMESDEALSNSDCESIDDDDNVSNMEEDHFESDSMHFSERENCFSDSDIDDTSGTLSDKENSTKTNTVRTRRRIRHTHQWKSNIAKGASNSGKEGVSKRGKSIKARNIGERCTHKKHNSSIISEEVRTKLFEKFWNLGSYEARLAYLARHVISEKPAERKVLLARGKIPKKKHTYKYHLTVDQQRIKVCRKMFLSTFGINKQLIMTLSKKRLKDTGDFIENDRRGHHSNRPHKVPLDMINLVINHINSFPTELSHFCRQSSSRLYLEDTLTERKMYDMYVEQEKQNNRKFVKFSYYREIFVSRFNLFFCKPKKDLCDVCESFKHLTKEEKDDEGNSINDHLVARDIARGWLTDDVNKVKTDKSSNSICVASYDLEKVLALPRSNASSMYYKRKISLLNFTIYDLVTHQGYCHVWNETVANRGANEIASCLWRFIEQKSEEGITEFRFYSDNCTGQNKNQFLYTMYLFAAKKFNVTITHRYLVKGHTQTAGDSMHSVIETAVNKQPLYTQDEYVTVMKECKVKEPKYKVHEMTQDEIYNFAAHSLTNFWAGKKISQITTITIKPNFEIICKYDYEENGIFETSCIEYADEDLPVLKKCYRFPIRLDSNKKKDLESLLKLGSIPATYAEYYKKLMR